jgi:rRNA maturation endonuclease Nob1
VAVCTGCGRRNPDGARFCNECAAPLEAMRVSTSKHGMR